MRLLGISQHAPEHVKGLVNKSFQVQKRRDANVFVLPVGGTVLKKSAVKADCIFIVRYADFVNNIDSLNHTRFADKPVFLFASVLRLTEVGGISVLDNSRLNDFSFRLTALSRLDIAHNLFAKVKDRKATLADKDFSAQLVADTMHGSFISPLMTLIYQLPITQQTQLKLRIMEWLATDQSVKEFRSRLKTSAANEYVDKLIALLEQEFVSEYRAAVKFVLERSARKKAVPYKQLLRKFKVTAYEIRYILAILSKDKKNVGIHGKTVEEIFYGRDRNKAIRRHTPEKVK